MGKILGMWGGMLGRSMQKAKNNKKIVTSALMIIVGGFFYFRNVNSSWAYYSQDYLLVSGKNSQQVDLSLIKAEASGSVNDARLVFAEGKPMTSTVILASVSNKKLEDRLKEMVGDTPIREMIPAIAKQDAEVAAYLVGIAKKESSWGLASPSKDGKTCYNYWGYKGAGSRGTGMGYGCYASPKEAVEIVGGKINELLGKNIKSPSQMVVWKCGSSCVGHDPAGVQSWISSVSLYRQKVLDLK
jgi:hypothetical protein